MPENSQKEQSQEAKAYTSPCCLDFGDLCDDSFLLRTEATLHKRGHIVVQEPSYVFIFSGVFLLLLSPFSFLLPKEIMLESSNVFLVLPVCAGLYICAAFLFARRDFKLDLDRKEVKLAEGVKFRADAVLGLRILTVDNAKSKWNKLTEHQLHLLYRNSNGVETQALLLSSPNRATAFALAKQYNSLCGFTLL